MGIWFETTKNSNVQYDWPPQDPSRLPNPRRPAASTSAFVYGNNGFNPNLKPSSTRNRRNRPEEQNEEGDAAKEWESDGGRSSQHTGSSPEQYLSDYDDGEWSEGDKEAEIRRRMKPRVRQGSEGWEVRPGQWEIEQQDPPRQSGRPWEDTGRYQVYEPVNDDNDSDDWGD